MARSNGSGCEIELQDGRREWLQPSALQPRATRGGGAAGGAGAAGAAAAKKVVVSVKGNRATVTLQPTPNQQGVGAGDQLAVLERRKKQILQQLGESATSGGGGPGAKDAGEGEGGGIEAELRAKMLAKLKPKDDHE